MKAKNPELNEIVATFKREQDDVNLAEILRYEKVTGAKIEKNLPPTTNIIPADKFMEMLSVLYKDFKSEVPIAEIKTSDQPHSFVRRVAYFAINKVMKGEMKEVNDLFIVLELSFKDGTVETRDFATTFLEDFQTVFFNEKMSFDLINSKVHPLTLQMWHAIDAFWKAAADFKKSHPEISSKQGQ